VRAHPHKHRHSQKEEFSRTRPLRRSEAGAEGRESVADDQRKVEKGEGTAAGGRELLEAASLRGSVARAGDPRTDRRVKRGRGIRGQESTIVAERMISPNGA